MPLLCYLVASAVRGSPPKVWTVYQDIYQSSPTNHSEFPNEMMQIGDLIRIGALIELSTQIRKLIRSRSFPSRRASDLNHHTPQPATVFESFRTYY